jgi:hypothetical protein
VVEDTTDEADTNQETSTQDGEQSTGNPAGMDMPSDMNNMNNNMPNMGQGGMGGGGQR